MRDIQQEILRFWFEETKPAQWFQKNPDFDQLIIQQFEDAYNLAQKGIFEHWKDTPEGCLAYIILLDQFPRNMFRNKAKAYETDEKALEIAKYAINKSFDQLLSPQQKRFIYLPFEHSEKLSDQNVSVSMFEKIKSEDPLGYEYALKHKEVIEKFGRFPHRNIVLGRNSTEEELVYLSDPSNGF